MRLSKDILAIGAIVPLGVLALVLGQSSGGGTGQAGEPGQEAIAAADADPTAEVDRIVYRVEGGSPTLRFSEVCFDGPGEARVRYQVHGKPVQAYRHPWPRERHERLLALFGEVHFFDAEEIGRRGHFPDMATTSIKVEGAGRTKEIVIDGRTQATVDLGPLVAVLDTVRREATLQHGD